MIIQDLAWYRGAYQFFETEVLIQNLAWDSVAYLKICLETGVFIQNLAWNMMSVMLMSNEMVLRFKGKWAFITHIAMFLIGMSKHVSFQRSFLCVVLWTRWTSPLHFYTDTNIIRLRIRQGMGLSVLIMTLMGWAKQRRFVCVCVCVFVSVPVFPTLHTFTQKYTPAAPCASTNTQTHKTHTPHHITSHHITLHKIKSHHIKELISTPVSS